MRYRPPKSHAVVSWISISGKAGSPLNFSMFSGIWAGSSRLFTAITWSIGGSVSIKCRIRPFWRELGGLSWARSFHLWRSLQLSWVCWGRKPGGSLSLCRNDRFHSFCYIIIYIFNRFFINSRLIAKVLQLIVSFSYRTLPK